MSNIVRVKNQEELNALVDKTACCLEINNERDEIINLEQFPNIVSLRLYNVTHIITNPAIYDTLEFLIIWGDISGFTTTKFTKLKKLVYRGVVTFPQLPPNLEKLTIEPKNPYKITSVPATLTSMVLIGGNISLSNTINCNVAKLKLDNVSTKVDVSKFENLHDLSVKNSNVIIIDNNNKIKIKTGIMKLVVKCDCC